MLAVRVCQQHFQFLLFNNTVVQQRRAHKDIHESKLITSNAFSAVPERVMQSSGRLERHISVMARGKKPRQFKRRRMRFWRHSTSADLGARLHLTERSHHAADVMLPRQFKPWEQRLRHEFKRAFNGVCILGLDFNGLNDGAPGAWLPVTRIEALDGVQLIFK